MSGLAEPEGEEILVICNNYIEIMIMADLKWNKRECLAWPTLPYASLHCL